MSDLGGLGRTLCRSLLWVNVTSFTLGTLNLSWLGFFDKDTVGGIDSVMDGNLVFVPSFS